MNRQEAEREAAQVNAYAIQDEERTVQGRPETPAGNESSTNTLTVNPQRMAGGITNTASSVVHGIGTIGGEVVNVVRDTANTAIAGVGSVGETAVHTLTGLLADLVGGIRDIGSAAVRGRGHATGEYEAEETPSKESRTKQKEERSEMMH